MVRKEVFFKNFCLLMVNIVVFVFVFILIEFFEGILFNVKKDLLGNLG